MRTITVNLPQAAYSIHVEADLLEQTGSMVRDVAAHPSAMLVMDANVASTHGPVAKRSLEAAGYVVFEHQVVAEEPKKTLPTIETLYAALLGARLERGSPVIALGGGLVGDVAGFAAATYLRGLPCIQIPTTLLAMVDASVGGKTGVNFPLPADPDGARELGKNLIGAFWQPRLVITDPTTLRTLGARDFRCGLAECVKHGMLTDASLLEFIGANASSILERELDVLGELIARCVQIKAEIVQEDEREAGRRALLNLGHTFAHAIEPIHRLDLRHGEAVSIGLCAACHCAVETGRMALADAESVCELLSRLGLPTRLCAPVPSERLIAAMGYDKKVASGSVRLVLPVGLGQAEVVSDPGVALLDAGWSSVSAGKVDG